MKPQQAGFKLKNSAILLGALSIAFPINGYCLAAGRADFILGKVEAIATDGSRRILSKGSEINPGDSINTALEAHAQIRFIDGGYVSLQPNTVFRVDEFNYKNKTDGEEKGFFSLLKGGLRAITGAIGHVNRDNYRVTTATATIGIRGTGYRAQLKDDGLYVSVGEGAIALSNDAGELLVSAGRAAFVSNKNTAPVFTIDQPNIPPASYQPVISPVLATNLVQIVPSLASGSGYSMVYASLNSILTGSSGAVNPANAVFNSTSQLINFSSGGSSPSSLDLGSATISSGVTDGVIGWGRWTGASTATGNYASLTPGVFDYVVGIPTAVMPTTGTGTYNILGSTSPTASNGSTGYSVAGNLVVNFALSNLNVNLTISNTAANTITIVQSALAGSIAINPGSTFSATGSQLTISSKGTFGACTISCSPSISGFFAGTNASRAGLSYSITGTAVGDVQGVVAFAKQ
jgi:hypothetical protein